MSRSPFRWRRGLSGIPPPQAATVLPTCKWDSVLICSTKMPRLQLPTSTVAKAAAAASAWSMFSSSSSSPSPFLLPFEATAAPAVRITPTLAGFGSTRCFAVVAAGRRRWHRKGWRTSASSFSFRSRSWIQDRKFVGCKETSKSSLPRCLSFGLSNRIPPLHTFWPPSSSSMSAYGETQH